MSSPSPDKDPQDLLARISEGDEEACREMVERYGDVLRAEVRRRLSTHVRRVMDLLDLVQEAWASFFDRLRDGKTTVEPEQLLSFLRQIARKKTAEANRHYLDAQKRDVRRAVTLDAPEATGENAPRSRDPAPVDALIAEERWERLILGKPHVQRYVLGLLRAGHTHEEVARTTGLNEKTIRRLLRYVETEAEVVGS